MSQHVSDNLPWLLTGDATREETLAAAAHLRTCPDCQQELVSAVVAHASLTSARRFAPEIVTGSARIDDDAAPLPDLTDVFAKAHEESAGKSRTSRGRRFMIGVAAAAVLATGVGVTVDQLAGSDSTAPPTRTVALSKFGIGTHSAKATLIGNSTMRIDATTLPKLDGKHFYEVWLTNPARTHLQAVGSIDAGNRAVLTVSPNVMSRYSAIEVSVQRVNQTEYSGTSVLRGTYG